MYVSYVECNVTVPQAKKAIRNNKRGPEAKGHEFESWNVKTQGNQKYNVCLEFPETHIVQL